MRTCRERSQSRKIDAYDLVILSIRVACERSPVGSSALRLEEAARDLVAREYRCSCAEFGAHVCDGAALRHAESLYSRSCILHDVSDSALYGELSQHLKDDILGAGSASEASAEFHFYHSRHRDVIGTSAHRYGNVHSAGSHGQHSESASGRCVRVRTDEGLARDTESLVMYLMADAVSRSREPYAVLRGDRLYVSVVVSVHEARLQRIVIDVCDRALSLYARYAYCFELEVSHRARRVLRKGLVYPEPYLAALYHLTAQKMCGYYLLCYRLSHFCSPTAAWS